MGGHAEGKPLRAHCGGRDAFNVQNVGAFKTTSPLCNLSLKTQPPPKKDFEG